MNDSILQADLKRNAYYLSGRRTRFLKAFRGAQNAQNIIIRKYYNFVCKLFFVLYNLEISPQTKIGGGLRIDHPYGITINPKTIIGNNCTLHCGILIGCEARGVRKGVPIIGNQVWIGAHAVIVGGVTIGDDVLIAPNAYVNCNIPSHSVVLGNPCSIYHKDHATENYINII